MPRVLFAVLILALFVLGAGTLIYRLSFGQTGFASRARVEGLTGSARILWHHRAELPPILDVTDNDDAARAQGFAQGQESAWTLLLWRQAGLGRLSEWFDAPLLPVDRLSRELGLAFHARRAFDALAPEERARLRAFAQGVNASLATDRARNDRFLTLLNIEPEPWEDWHALVVERLVLWISTEIGRPDTLSLPPDVQAFLSADSTLRAFLCADDLNRALAWTHRDSLGTHVSVRYVTGSSALPFFQEAVLRRGGEETAFAAFPGTPFAPFGQGTQTAWALLPSSTARLELRPARAVPPRPERLRALDEREVALLVREAEGAFYFSALPPAAPRPTLDTTTTAPDTLLASRMAWSLSWPGFSDVSDAAAWFALQDGAPPAFRLFDARGLRLDGAGNAVPFSAPSATHRTGIVVGEAENAAYLAARLDSLSATGTTPPAEWADDVTSEWARRLVPGFFAKLDTSLMNTSQELDAYAYLRNWNYSYDRAGIGATVFHTWLGVYADSLGLSPEAARLDTAYFSQVRRASTFRSAVQRLVSALGPDPGQWRWERANADVRRFPVWSMADPLGLHLPSFERYDSFPLPGEGHPTTLRWGDDPFDVPWGSNAVWQATFVAGQSGSLRLRRLLLRPEQFLARHRVAGRAAPHVSVLYPTNAEQVTVLLSR